MPEVELSAGTIEYQDTGGSGPVIVLLPGLAMDGTLWRHVVRELCDDHRCMVPTLPLGSHRRPMHADADLSPRGIARLEAEFLDALDLREVTLVGNDSGLLQLAAAEHPERIARLVITSCEAFQNFPPGLPGRAVALAGRLPGGLNALVQPLRLRALRRLPLALGWMAKRPIPGEVHDAWLAPLLGQRAIRRDLAKYLRAGAKDPGVMRAAAEGLRGFDRPALVVWAAEDRVMPPEHGRRLAELLPNARLLELPDSYTLIPEDQPAELAGAIRQFIHTRPFTLSPWPAPGTEAAQAWIFAFAEGWRAPTGADAFADHFEPWLHPHVRLIQPGMPMVVGRRAFRERFARPLFALIPDLHDQVERSAVDADCAYVELTLRGTLGGRPVACRACDRVTLRDGVVVERKSYFDPLVLLRAILTRPRAWPAFARARTRERLRRANRR